MKMAIAGVRHSHIFELLPRARALGVEIVGAWEANDEAREKAASLGLTFPYASYDDLLSDNRISLVAIGDTYGRRGDLCIRALRAGKPVLSDKPLCVRPEELLEIDYQRKRTKLRVGLMLSLRYDPWARAVIDCARTLGPLRAATFQGQHPLLEGVRPGWYFDPHQYSGVMNDIAIHGVDFLRALTGKEPTEILSARAWNAYSTHTDFRDCGQMMLRWHGGAGVIGDVSYAVPDSFGYSLPDYWRFQLWFAGGYLTFSLNDPPVLYARGATEPVHLEPCPTDRSDLLDMLEPEKALVTTEDVIKSSRATMHIQSMADLTEFAWQQRRTEQKDKAAHPNPKARSPQRKSCPPKDDP